MPRDFTYGKAKYGMDGIFRGICRELLAQTALESELPIYDTVLIDEAQDLPPEFPRPVHRFTKDPKRIVWAYDELQTLSEAVMPDTAELFGKNDAGVPLVTPDNAAGQPRQDIILPVCSRNTPWALTLAHVLGFGIYREAKLVQHFDDPTLWQKIGYRVLEGKLEVGANVTIERAPESSPEFFNRLLQPDDAVVSKSFADELEQAEWIAESVNEEPHRRRIGARRDILIVLPNPLTAKNNAVVIGDSLARRNIPRIWPVS